MPFVRRTPNAAGRPPAGTIPSPSAPSLALISTGIPSFDDILGGGQPVGSILTVLAPDEHSAWSRLVERYWIAQGLAAGQDVLVIGGSTTDDDSSNGKRNIELEDLVAGCMWLDEGVKKSMTRQVVPEPAPAQTNSVPDDPDSDAEGLDEEHSNRTKIAWRYENMKKFQTTVSGNNSGAASSFHHTFNLTNTIPSAVLSTFRSSKQLALISPTDGNTTSGTSTGSSQYAVFRNLLNQLHEALKERGALPIEQDPVADATTSHISKKAVRIILHEFGSLDWTDSVSITSMHRFLHSLRMLIRDSSASVFITLPTYLAHEGPITQDHKGKNPMYEPLMTSEEWLKSLGWASDACVEFQGFAAQKHSSLLGLGAGSTGQNNLAFKLKRKRLIIETLHLGVEGGVGERRTEPTRTGGPLDARKMQHHGNDLGHVHEHGHSHHHHHPPAEGVDKTAAESSVRFAAVDIAVEAEPSVRSSDSRGGAEPTQSKERKKVSFIRHDKPELYEF
ncbi:hypothetical protein QFC22_004136 [Naganishia vaughanmartiniae]|uniref:Uncharacterized protein n=1 Tax=Naganishia vaughanmartiniae TaxID=1424756 RepID=A0ACC2X4G1_9TREE|nr:hypothetical protein QFC22_004136 [Naganishia vaughanmartiniae]